MFCEKILKIILVLIIFLSLSCTQECPEIYVPPYGEKPRECQTSIGSTCLITCPDDFDIIGSCFRTCILADENRQQTDFSANLKLNKKIIRPFLIGLKPKKMGFLPTTPINKRINSGRQTSCCNKQYRESKNNEFTKLLRLKTQNLESETCPNQSLPEHHLLQSLSRLMRSHQEEMNISGRQQSGPRWSGEQPYCVNTDVQCPELSPNENSFFYYCPNYAGLSCAIGCQLGYRLIGARILLCSRQGVWSDPLPTCQQI